MDGTDWVAGELELLRTFWPDLEYVPEGHWVLKRGHQVPDGWSAKSVDLAIRIPANLPGEQPYGFWVRGGLLFGPGLLPGSYTFPAQEPVPFALGDQWGKFSWAVEGEKWDPKTKPGEGTGMILFAASINRRLSDGQ